MKNKKSLKNLKQFRVKSKFLFYVQFRPRAQKWFFPICFLIFSIACANHWYSNRGTWVFENASAAVYDETSLIETAQSVSGGLEVSGMAAKSPASVAVSVGGNQLPSVSGSAIEVIQKVARETDTDWKVLAAICIKESNCNTNRIGDGGLSYGAFQMHQKWQPNTKSCAVDFECAATWTAKRLKKHEHLGLWDMIRSHNGLVGDRNGDGEVDNAYYPNDVLKIIETL